MSVLYGLALERHPLIPFPGLLMGRTVYTPDPERFVRELDLVRISGRAPLLVRCQGPARPQHLPPRM